MKTVSYYTIDGAPGWSQDWFRDWWMHLGGCAAVTACDSNILLARDFGRTALYPYDPTQVTRRDYERYAMQMKPYLRPRRTGIDRLSIYLEGITRFWHDRDVFSLRAEGLPGEAPWTDAWDLVRQQIDGGIVVPCLLLHHRDKAFDDFQWHWFNLAGYDERGGETMVQAVTYAHTFWLDLRALWHTGYAQKGGLVRLISNE